MFFLCWLPFHVQRLFTIFLNEMDSSSPTALHSIFNLVFYISGLFYFCFMINLIYRLYILGYCFYSNSACNPILYNILSEKYRLAFCKTILGHRLTEKMWAKRLSFRTHCSSSQFSRMLHRYSEDSVKQFQRSLQPQNSYESMTSLYYTRRPSNLQNSTRNFLHSQQSLNLNSKNNLSLNNSRQILSNYTACCVEPNPKKRKRKNHINNKSLRFAHSDAMELFLKPKQKALIQFKNHSKKLFQHEEFKKENFIIGKQKP